MTSVPRRRRLASQELVISAGVPLASMPGPGTAGTMPHLLARTMSFRRRAEAAAHQGLVVTLAVNRGRVEERDAQVQRAVDQRESTPRRPWRP